MSKENVKDAIEELNALEKSEKQLEDDGISALEKALADYDDEGFEKSEKDEEDDKGGEAEGDEDGKGDDDPAGDEGGGDEDDTKKSMDDELEQELVKASEAYADLEASVHALSKSQGEQNDELRSAVASLTSLTVAIGRGVVGLRKSISEFGGQPFITGKKPLLGEGRKKVSEGFAKSKSEVIGLIKSAAEDGKLDIKWMGKVSVHGPECLPDDIKSIIGL
jgi:hypothetical protein